MNIAVSAIVSIVSASIAVVIGHVLQMRSERRKDKLAIFKTLMFNRWGWSVESVRALNIIDIVFADDKSVRQRWKEYYDLLCIQAPNEMQLKQIQTAQDKLLEAMANSLGYKDKITWETIQNPYVPKGMIASIQQQQNIQAGYEQFAGLASHLSQMLNKGQAEESAPSTKESNTTS